MPLNNRMRIRVPASTANLGPGFDSIGLAVNLYLTLEVEQSNQWEFYSANQELADLPNDEQHFIAQVAIGVAKKYGKEMSPYKVKVASEIPLARGLGSSASAIVAGIELADIACELALTREDKLLLATELEGHPDNVGASIYGGLVVGSYQQNEVDMLSFTNLPFEAVVVIPKETLLTKDSRDVLPKEFSRSEAIAASSTANLLVAALLSENWQLAGKMMERDRFHQPYRRPLIPFYQAVENAAKKNGAFGTALSGAGPTVICFTEKAKGRKLAHSLQQLFSEMSVKLLSIDYFGSLVEDCEPNSFQTKKLV
ncbi:homoserine kinase [Neobacillus sp. YIM B02564]|jgi:homoserine kinase|uniref:Homoserine kinase n=1 Tax=Neobacillus paridis TaxID=2803862 RepID=A0ABS1TT68_9BACI|nr:homoserine kinase [Neobacillus paridis]MBL4954505.1 homoserine kinase [Neobacillus paridis]